MMVNISCDGSLAEVYSLCCMMMIGCYKGEVIQGSRQGVIAAR